ncbi:MAG: hypothetical protein QHC79_25940 [Pseudosphingobacterium sp.]|nr:hypothetical protein [Pseudosphingobacterium sp.]
MEKSTSSFLHLMTQKGFNRPFGLYRDRTVALAINASLKECLSRLADHQNTVDRKEEYLLTTDVESPLPGKPIKCQFFFSWQKDHEIRVYKMKFVPPEIPTPPIRHIQHNRMIPGSALITYMFPELKRQRYGDFRTWKRRF